MRNKSLPSLSTGPRARLLMGVLAIAAAYPLHAQTMAPQAAPARTGQMTLRSDPALADIVVETDTNMLPADGRSQVAVTVHLLDANGQPLRGTTWISADSNGGRIVDPRAAPGLRLGAPVDRLLRGTRIEVEDGIARFIVVAPPHAQDVTLSVASGALQAQGQLSFVAERRPLFVTGVAEGVIGRRQGSSGGPQRFDDGFEQSLTHWSRQFNGGKDDVAARLAFFMKGDVGADSTVTAAYDSEKANNNRLLRDLDPNRFYPVYGDEAVTAFDARSTERLYLRLDQRKNYLLYGDFVTSAEFSQLAGGGAGSDASLHKLGQYNRTATGLRGHYEEGAISGNAFAIHDSLRQVTEEYQANGTSGPFAVRSNSAIQNSDKVELLVRDKNQSNLVKQAVVLQRYVDYSFEPFSGRILFNQAIATLTPDGDPQSIRITYEVDQGGDKFWVAGADANVALGGNVKVGASIVEDRNPDSPYQLQSVAGQIRLGAGTELVAEVARSNSTTYTVGQSVSATPTRQAGEQMDEREGNAGRIELRHQDERLEARAWWHQAGRYFNNTAAGLGAGQSDAGASAKWRMDGRTRLYAEAVRSDNDYADAARQGQRVGVLYALSERLNLDLSLRHVQENGQLTPNAGIAPNTAPPGGTQNQSGGFFGSLDGAGLDTLSGLPLNAQATQGGAAPAPYRGVDATTARLGVQFKASDKLTVSADAEHSVDGERQHRYGLGVQYATESNGRLYARAETQSGLASSYSINPAERGTSVVAGVDTSYMAGGTMFSEYRLRDSAGDGAGLGLDDERNAQLASGLRNSWQLRPGVNVSTGAEYVKVLNGSAQEAVALSGAIDYRIDPLWSASAKLEYRKLFDRADQPANQGQDQWLNTVALARKISDDWTLLARNYLLYQRNRADALGAPLGNTLQDRAQLGFAWRPRERNDVNALARYEYKTVRDHARPDGENYRAHIVSTHVDYHPSRPWWITSRLAGKLNTDHTLPAGEQKYSAWLLGGRTVLDVAPKWDVGVLVSVLYSPQGRSRQYAYGAEVGYQLARNLYLSVGHNLSGFTDKDLAGTDYTAHGTFVRLRFKFDEKTFKSGGVM
ncbi:hypothetical protein FHI69_14925 [Janthinobacterium lividum]|uniref:TonB-dependent receptor n=1 Tax=Janthinobacterium lividum TaxID=29581 RepID=A0A5C4NQ15_9BURK|nr:Ig-like domain-containing protein [Janthinobacterium lividum]TNC76232.1 hypothetical protein FHI69_14925 [Janthinobacterium lividum]